MSFLRFAFHMRDNLSSLILGFVLGVLAYWVVHLFYTDSDLATYFPPGSIILGLSSYVLAALIKYLNKKTYRNTTEDENGLTFNSYTSYNEPIIDSTVIYTLKDKGEMQVTIRGYGANQKWPP